MKRHVKVMTKRHFRKAKSHIQTIYKKGGKHGLIGVICLVVPGLEIIPLGFLGYKAIKKILKRK